MNIPFFELIGASFVIVNVMMLILWAIGEKKNNIAIVDVGWAMGFVLSSWAFLIIGDGFWVKRLLVVSMVSIWGGRLAWHLWQRFDFSKQDPRYTSIQKSMGEDLASFKNYFQFLFQGFLIIILTIPFIIVAGYGEESFSLWELLGFILWGVGLYGESLADYQLDQFRKNPENEGKVCDQGLWNYSRHPNYFFEFVVWLGFFFFAFASPLGWLAIIAPIMIYVLLTQVSGVPLAEQQSLKSRGDTYREYQKRTSTFFPMPPKS